MARILSKRVPGRPGYKLFGRRTQRTGKFAGLRTLIKRDESKGITMPEHVNARPNGVKASLTTALAGANNDLAIQSLLEGADGNNLRVRYVVAGNNTPLSASVSGKDITVNVGTNNVGAAISTAAAVRDILNGAIGIGRSQISGHRRIVRALVKAELAAGNDGTGVVAALAFTNLAGGVNGSDMRAGPGVAGATSAAIDRQRPTTPPGFPGAAKKKVRQAPSSPVRRRL